MQRKCRDPCPGTCGQSAVCLVSNHIPMCSCPSGMQGDPFISCRPVPGNFFLKTANIFSGLILKSPFQLLLLLSLANLAHVDQTASVEKSMTRQYVHVFLVSSGRHLLADLSVLLAQSVGRTKPASIKNAEILAQELVVLEQNAMSSTTIQFAVVHHDTLVIHFQDAILNVSLKFFIYITN
jgi:hypothetical protein